ncbi:hypothetical protein U1Q18_007919 [Sarracenia purpurea var. burkii]
MKSDSKPVLDEVKFQQAVSQLPPRFTAEELYNITTLQEDPLVCLELFNLASKQPRFRHNDFMYHIIIKKLGAAKLYGEMDDIVNRVLDVPYIGSESLYNTIIYFFTEDRKLTKAVNVYKHMRNSKNVDYRPSIRTQPPPFGKEKEEKKENPTPFSWSQTPLDLVLPFGATLPFDLPILFHYNKFHSAKSIWPEKSPIQVSHTYHSTKLYSKTTFGGSKIEEKLHSATSKEDLHSAIPQLPFG